MSDEIIFNRGLDSKLHENAEITNGALSISEDCRNLYLDSNGRRIHISDIIDISNLSEDDKLKIKPSINKLYIDGKVIKKYNGSEYITLSDINKKTVCFSENEEFEYDRDLQTFTITMPENADIGTLIIDKCKSLGVIDSIYENDFNKAIIKIIVDNKSKNTLSGYDIYYDSNYAGDQVGTSEKPFNNWNDLYSNCSNILLLELTPVTIHLRTNSTVDIEASKFNGINNLLLIGESSSGCSIDFNDDVSNINNVIFDSISINNFNVVNSRNISIINSLIDQCKIEYCYKNISFNNAEYINSDSKIQISNCGSADNYVYITINNCSLLSVIGETIIGSIDICNSKIFNSLKFENSITKDSITNNKIYLETNMYFLNTGIYKEFTLHGIKDVYLASGIYYGFNDNHTAIKQPDFGTFDEESGDDTRSGIDLGAFCFIDSFYYFDNALNHHYAISSQQVTDREPKRFYYDYPNKLAQYPISLTDHLNHISEAIQDLSYRINNVLILSSSTPGSNKKFRIRVYDDGQIVTQEVQSNE